MQESKEKRCLEFEAMQDFKNKLSKHQPKRAGMYLILP